MSELIALFDIDGTVFNTDAIRELYRPDVDWNDQGLPLKDNLYPETKGVLGEIGKRCRLGIFSQGIPDFQRAKLVETGIVGMFDPQLLFIHQSKTDEIAEIVKAAEGRKILVVDDRPSFLKIIKDEIPHAITVRIRRGKYVDEEVEGFKPDFEFDSLSEVSAIVHQN